VDPAVCYERLYVVSDLHLGGEPGSQIFAQGAELAALIEFVRNQPGQRVGLVLNGDIVDFLAERKARYLDPSGAVTKLERIFADPAFSMVWKALQAFVQTDTRELVLVVGNHDVELALPRVRERLLVELCGGAPAARGRVRFALDGAGFACLVGGRRVLCTHGNEVDTFNVVDFRQLLEIQRAENRGQPFPEWTPNAGTKLVIDVMNDVKARFPFVDLLKPETSAVPAIVFAVDPQAAKRIAGLAPVAVRLAVDAARLKAGLLAEEPSAAAQPGSDEAAVRQLLGAGFPSVAAQKLDTDSLLQKVELELQAGPASGTGTQQPEVEMLGVGGLFVDRLLKRDPAENLREALQSWLGNDRTFEPDMEDATFCDLDRSVSADVDFVVAGHTHLERALRRKSGRGVYFNSGTWIRLIRLTKDMLSSQEAFKPVFRALTAGTVSELDRARHDNESLVIHRPTVVEIAESPSGAVGRLAYVRTTPATRLETVAGTELGV
jgi:UDP-2,3-diacylglucosamine pyrophosphatase LpxH